MLKDTIVADTGAAIIAVKFIAVANLVPAFGAFYGAIDELKHLTFRSLESPIQKSPRTKHSRHSDRCGLARIG
jgi:hypothetical protein